MTLWQRRRGKATRHHEDIRVQVLEDRGGGEPCLLPAMETPGRVVLGPALPCLSPVPAPEPSETAVAVTSLIQVPHWR